MTHLFSIQEEESFWTLNSGTLTLNIEKVDQMSWWEHLVTSDVKINTKKVSPENSKLGGTTLFIQAEFREISKLTFLKNCHFWGKITKK